MLLVLMSGLALAGAAVALLGRALVMPRVKASETLEQIAAYGFRGGQGEPEAGRAPRGGVGQVAGRLGGLVAGRFGERREATLRNELVAAGLYRTHPRDFLGYRILSMLAFAAFVIWAAGSTGAIPSLALPLVLVLGVYAGWTFPMTFVRRRAKRRFERIERELPELIDLLVVTVEAGLGFSHSLQLAADRLAGPLGDELRLTLAEQRMGLSTLEALRNMLSRCDIPAVRSFVRSIVQGEALGVSIGDIMRNLAVDMRKRRRQAAEERAQKAPVKLLFPLIFLIFPAMFMVILGPAMFTLLKAFSGM